MLNNRQKFEFIGLETDNDGIVRCVFEGDGMFSEMKFKREELDDFFKLYPFMQVEYEKAVQEYNNHIENSNSTDTA